MFPGHHHHRLYPNPDAVAYPTGYPLKYPCQQTTRAAAKMYPMHQHGAWIDKDGNGNTDMDAGHFHRVRGFKVLPDESDGHTHELTMLPCGAGAPQTTGRDGPIMSVDGRYLTVPRSVDLLGPGLGASGVPKWVWVVGGIVVAGVIAAVVYHHVKEED